MKHFWIVSLIAACWLCPWQAFSITGRNSAIHFTRISIESGLSQSTVFSIAQDRAGNIWFATYDGVNKYDGYEFTVYQHILDDETSLADDISRTLCSDLEGRIWVGTASGLSLYDEDLDIFRNWGHSRSMSFSRFPRIICLWALMTGCLSLTLEKEISGTISFRYP